VSKIYNTKQKKEILRCFEENKTTCLKARDIMDMVSSDIGEATVYRTLAALTEEGKIKKFISEKGQSSYYQFVSDEVCSTHFHLKCIECGELIHLDCVFLDHFEKHIKDEHDFEVDNGKTVIYGKCKKCRYTDKNRI